MLWLWLSLAFAHDQAVVESALAWAEMDPSVENTLKAVHLSHDFRQHHATALARVFETYALALHYPYDERPFSESVYTDNFEQSARKARKHPISAKAVCALRDIFYTEGVSERVEQIEAAALRHHLACGPVRRVEKLGPVTGGDANDVEALRAQLADALAAQEAAREMGGELSPEARAELHELERRLAERLEQAKVDAEVDAKAERAARQDPDQALQDFDDYIARLPAHTACDGKSPAQVVMACGDRLANEPGDVSGWVLIARAHLALAEDGEDVKAHFSAALAALRMAEGLVEVDFKAAIRLQILAIETR